MKLFISLSSKKYYSLLVKENNKWSIEFGDYDKEVVKDELESYKDSGYKSKDLKIITTNSDQASIEKELKKLNG